MNFQPRSRRDLLQLLGVCALPLLGVAPLIVTRQEQVEEPLEFDTEHLDVLQHDPPEVVLIGNSMVYCRLNIHYLPDLMAPLSVETIAEGGTRSLQWFLWLKNHVVATQPHAKVVFLFYRDYDFHRANFRVSGKFLNEIRRTMREGDQAYLRLARGQSQGWGVKGWLEDRFDTIPLNSHCRSKVEDTAMDAAALLTGGTDKKIEAKVSKVFDLLELRRDVQDAGIAENDNPILEKTQFSADPGKNYLSHFASVAGEHGIKLVFYRVRRRPDETNHVEQTDLLRQYTADFKAWAESLGHAHVDETDDERITLEMFRDGDHLYRESYDAYTEMFYQRVKHLLPTRFTPEEMAAGKEAARKARKRENS